MNGDQMTAQKIELTGLNAYSSGLPTENTWHRLSYFTESFDLIFSTQPATNASLPYNLPDNSSKDESSSNWLPEDIIFLTDTQALARDLKNLLKTYQTKRNKQYRVKDALTGKDKERREQFVEDINLKLDNYAEKGLQEDFLNVICSSRDQFPGINLQTTLNKIIVELLNSTSLVNADSDKAFAEYFLTTTTNKAYKDKTEELHKKIEAMSTYGSTLPKEEERMGVKELAKMLHQDLNSFVAQHAKKPWTIEDYNKFEIKFKARLHSQDDLMNKHTHNWKFIIVNILAALALIPLAVKLIHSKLTENRATFFFDKTDKQRERDKVEQGLNDFTNPQDDGPPLQQL